MHSRKQKTLATKLVSCNLAVFRARAVANEMTEDEAESQAEGAQSQAGDIASKAAGAKDQAQGTAEEGAEVSIADCCAARTVG